MPPLCFDPDGEIELLKDCAWGPDAPVCLPPGFEPDACPTGYLGSPPVCIRTDDTSYVCSTHDDCVDWTVQRINEACATAHGACALAWVVVGIAVVTVGVDTCPELDDPVTINPTCPQYELNAGGDPLTMLMVESGGDDFDNLYPTFRNYNHYCTDSYMDGWFCMTDNRSLTVFLGRLDDISRDSTATTLTDSYNTTDLNVGFESRPDYSGDSETDIIYVIDSDVQDDATGSTWCDDGNDGVQCDQHYVAYRYEGRLRGIACHETGHAVGLTHGQQAYARDAPDKRLSNNDPRLACMTTKPIDSAYLGEHNVRHINDEY